MQTGEGVSLPKVSSDKCPICGKAPHPDRTTTDKKEKKGCLKSIPKNLGCSQIPIRSDLPNYATAAHHLIPANQCLKQFPRLSQMCTTVGYDVNNSKNGLSLPTCGQKHLNAYATSLGAIEKYGKLDEPDKENAAFAIMKGLKLQFHVGHHNWSMDYGTDSCAHDPNYNELVKTRLRAFERRAERNGDAICNPQDNSESGSALISELNALSQQIKVGILAMKIYFVSAISYQFSKKYPDIKFTE